MAVDQSQLPDASSQLAAANAELTTLREQNKEFQTSARQAQLGEARARALKDFSTVDEDVLNFYSGEPAGLYEFAKKWDAKMAAATPAATPGSVSEPATPASAAQTPAPAPGPGSNIPPDSARKIQMEEWRRKAMDKDIDMGGRLGPNGSVSSTRGGSEARIYYETSLGEGLREHFAKSKR